MADHHRQRLNGTDVISAAIAGHLAWPGTICLRQKLHFKVPVRPGDTFKATITVKEPMLE